MTLTPRKVAALNKEFAFLIHGGQPRIVRFVGTRVDSTMSVEAFKLLVSNRDKKNPNLGTLWLNHPQRRTYIGATFDPSSAADPNKLNLWGGLAIVPMHGDCEIVLEFIRNVVCAENDEAFRYVIGWAANLVREPGNKPGTCLVLRGGQGTGKSTFAEILCALLGEAATIITSSRQLAGHFNSHVSQRVLVVLEEAPVGKADSNAVKHIITGSTMRCEPKGVDAFDVPNNLRLVICTNEGQAIQAQGDERRYCVLDVSAVRRGDAAYFQRLRDFIKAGGLANFLHYLLTVDTSGIDLRVVPQTTALDEQKMGSLEGLDYAMCELLSAGKIKGAEWPREIERSILVEALNEYCGARQKPFSFVAVGMYIKKLFGDVSASRESVGRRRRYWRLPDLQTAKATFAARTGLTKLFEDSDESGQGVQSVQT